MTRNLGILVVRFIVWSKPAKGWTGGKYEVTYDRREELNLEQILDFEQLQWLIQAFKYRIKMYY